MKQMPGNKTTDLRYWKHFHVTTTHGCADPFLCFVHINNVRNIVSGLPVMTCWLTDGEETTDVLIHECRLSRRVAPSSSSQFGLRRPLQARPLMMTVLRATKNCPKDGLLLDPQCKQIAPNVFSSASWFMFQVSRHLNFPSSFTLLQTCWTAAIVINHPVCAGAGWICSYSLLRNFQFCILLAAFCQCSKSLLVLLSWQRKTLPWLGCKIFSSL